MSKHKKIEELTKDWSQERKDRVKAMAEQLRKETRTKAQIEQDLSEGTP